MSPMYSHSELVELGYKYLMKTIRCSFAFKELSGLAVEIPDVIGFMVGTPATFLLECKTSRSDSLADKKKPFREDSDLGMGSYRSFLCEPGIIKVEDLPPRWGLLYAKDGKVRRVHGFKRDTFHPKNPFFFPGKNLQAEWSLMGSALRRMEIRDHLDEIYAGHPAFGRSR